MAAINRWSSAGSRGRPGRDRQRQKSRKASRCQRTSVAGWTMVRASRQAKQRAKRTSVSRSGSEARRGFTCRSRYRAKYFRRNRFSAARAVRVRRLALRNRTRSIPSEVITRPRRRDGCIRCMNPPAPRLGSVPQTAAVLAAGGEFISAERTVEGVFAEDRSKTATIHPHDYAKSHKWVLHSSPAHFRAISARGRLGREPESRSEKTSPPPCRS